ncbi:hypothetical protein KGQ71_04285 [Patescibacteria group bacterium]|nr:hypothetical protein [Patescibacteria group bacterium]
MIFLQLAERHLQELVQVTDSSELEHDLQAVSALAEKYEEKFSKLLKG